MGMPKDLQAHFDTLAIAPADKAEVEFIIDKYPEAANEAKHLMHIFPDHDRLQFKILWADNPGHKLYDYQFLLNGLLIRSKKLCRGVLREVHDESSPGSASLLRAQCETLACAVYVERNPQKLEAILKGEGKNRVNVLTQIDHAEKKHKGLRGDYDALSDLVHPNSASHFSSITPGKMVGKKLRVLFTPEGNFKRSDAVSTVKLLVVWTGWTLQSLESINTLWSKHQG
jgi:hypothetical protein